MSASTGPALILMAPSAASAPLGTTWTTQESTVWVRVLLMSTAMRKRVCVCVCVWKERFLECTSTLPLLSLTLATDFAETV